MTIYKVPRLITIGGLIIIMGFFTTVFGGDKSNGRFVSEKAFQQNLEKRVSMSTQILKQLREYDVTEKDQLKLEYFFYTNTADKAVAFAEVLSKKGYTVEYGETTDKVKTFIITGWTTPMLMEESIVVDWVRQMCQLGFEKDCDFDGWGTYPDQD